jgi:hypothetical protein
MNAKSERDMKTKNPKTKNPNPNKRVLKRYGYGFLVDTLCIFSFWVKYGSKYLTL